MKRKEGVVLGGRERGDGWLGGGEEGRESLVRLGSVLSLSLHVYRETFTKKGRNIIEDEIETVPNAVLLSPFLFLLVNFVPSLRLSDAPTEVDWKGVKTSLLSV